MSRYLLPSGLRDLLPPEAAKLTRLVYLLLQRFSLFGYEQVTPPLIEFEETMKRLWEAIACDDVKEAAFWLSVLQGLDSRPFSSGVIQDWPGGPSSSSSSQP